MAQFMQRSVRYGLDCRPIPHDSAQSLSEAFARVTRPQCGKKRSRRAPLPLKIPERNPASMGDVLSKSFWVRTAVHLYGNLEAMTSDDVLSYFSAFHPERVCWIDDSCCNVYFRSEMDAILAVLNLSVIYPVKHEGSISSNSAELYLVRLVQQWRLGCSYQGGEFLLMRLATVCDAKSSGVVRGNPNLPYRRQYKRQA
jgi:hypothetical protein